MEPMRCPETSVNDYQTTPCNNPEESRFHQNHGGSLKSSYIPMLRLVFEHNSSARAVEGTTYTFRSAQFLQSAVPSSLRFTTFCVPRCCIFIRRSENNTQPARYRSLSPLKYSTMQQAFQPRYGRFPSNSNLYQLLLEDK
jgi:hypothetical protein